VAAWRAAALVGSCELFMMVIRSAQAPGQPRAQQLRAFLGTLDSNPAGCWGVRDARLAA
jgi:3-dehydroquinate dehydratase